MKNLKRYNQLFESQQELTQEQKDWLDTFTIGSWSVNPKTGLVDVEGDFNCFNLGLKDFKGVRFGSVSGDFNYYENQLTSLEGAPRRVDGDFNCSANQLTSLEGAPLRVLYSFFCSFNNLTSLNGLPEGFSVGGSFNCSNNDLTSLEGLPEGFKLSENFNCSNNDLTSLEGLPEGFSVGKIFGCSNNNLTSLEGAPQSIGGNIVCSGNPIFGGSIERILRRMSDEKITLEQAVSDSWEKIPEDDHIYLAKHNPDLTPEDKRIYRAMELNMKRR